MRMSAVAVWCVVGLVALGCARRGSVEDPVRLASSEPITLEVANNSWQDVVIYVVRSGQRIRLMTVSAANTNSQVLRSDLIGPGGEVRVLAYPIGGGRRYTSPRVFAQPGTTVAVSLETDLRLSSVVIW